MGDNSFVYSNTNFTYSSTPSTSDYVVYIAPSSGEEWSILEGLTAQQIAGYAQTYEEMREHIRRLSSKNRCFDKGKKIKPLQLSYNDLMQFN